MNIKKANIQIKTFLTHLILIGFLISFPAPAFGQVVSITIEQLLESLDHPQVLILDVRTSETWKARDTKIKGALRKNPDNFDSWADEIPKDKFLVLY